MARSTSRARALAFQRQQGCCNYCGMLMWLNNPNEIKSQFPITARQANILQCTSEHLRARCDGGGDEASNIAASCRCCNHRRHARKTAPSHEDYREMVRARVLQRRWHCDSIFARLPPPRFPGDSP